MSMLSLMGALEIGLIFALVALGVWISFRVLDFPDLTADGSFPLGGAVAAVLIVGGWNPWLACGVAALAGAGAGLVTGWLNVRLNILQLLASILTMIALYSINLRIMGAPNVPLLGEPTVFAPFVGEGSAYWVQPLVLAVIVLAVKLALDWFFASQTGLALRATGANPRMARAQGIPTGRLTMGGMALSNALIALGGALYVQTQGGSDISMGLGTIGFADALDRLKPDMVVVLGDRFEALAVVQAALIMRIPVAHLHGGRVTLGDAGPGLKVSLRLPTQRASRAPV